MATCPPDAPDDFHVEKIIGNSSLMLAWKPVTVDNMGCNNGVKVTGYKVMTVFVPLAFQKSVILLTLAIF